MEEENSGLPVKTALKAGTERVDASMVIVNWNTRELLLGCIQSIMEETRASALEIIVVDNASTDGSIEAVKERFPEVRVIANAENLGFARANNIGIRESTGRYVCLVNSDIIALDLCVDRMVDYLDEHEDIGALGPKTINEHRKLRRNCREFPSLRNAFCQALFLDRIFPRSRLLRGRTLDYDFLTPREIEVLSGCFLMVRRKALEEVGLLDENFFIYGEDVDWGRRFHDQGWKCVLYPGAQAIHIGGASSSRQNIRFLLERMRADHQYWAKHHTRVARFLYVGISVLHYTLRTLGWILAYILKPSNREEVLHKLKASYAQAQWHVFHKDWKHFE
ncbi:MAG: glycosyltransferase family 2 protein [Planctomycetota bacterium]|jgi:GT2 family glycosyltransferase